MSSADLHDGLVRWLLRWRTRLRPGTIGLRLRHWLGAFERLRVRWVLGTHRKLPRHPAAPLVLWRPAHAIGPETLTAHLDPRDALRPAVVRRTLAAHWPGYTATLVVLVRYRRPPLLAGRADAEVRSWAAPPTLLARLPSAASTPLLTVLDAAFRLPDVRVQVVQVGGPASAAAPVEPPVPAPPIAWIIPHRGSARWLAECLARVAPQLRGSTDEAIVGLDEPPTPATAALGQTYGQPHPGVWLGALRRPGVGPYVVRQRAVERTTAPWVLFQDSDDVPTLDRALTLGAALAARELDAVGSHELRLDYLSGQVLAVRFPLDASAALRVASGHPALFPTLLVRRASLLAAGGFSTHLRFARDTQLLLRASFGWRIGNADAFLYLRRRRTGSLTTDPATALGSPAREAQRAAWNHDFAAIQTGQLVLADSRLAVRRGAEYEGNGLEAVVV